jgi:hypothetical protein
VNAAGLVDLPGSRRGCLGAGVGQAQRGVLGRAELMEWQHVDLFDVTERGREFRQRADVGEVVGPVWNEDEAHPDRLAASGEPAGEGERRRYATAGYPPGDGRVERLDVEQDQVGGVKQFVVGPRA